MIQRIKDWFDTLFYAVTYKHTYWIGRRKVVLIREYDVDVDMGEYTRRYHRYLYRLESDYLADEPIIFDTVVKIKEPWVFIEAEGLDK